MSLRSLFAKVVPRFDRHGRDAPEALDYERWVHLDAEDLAEQGIGAAYQRLLPELDRYVALPTRIDEVIDNDVPSYSVWADGVEYVVYSPSIPGSEADSWWRATHAFFQCVNVQLVHQPVRFYAINGGNDLGGMFLTPEQATAACRALPKESDWPYLPSEKGPS